MRIVSFLCLLGWTPFAAMPGCAVRGWGSRRRGQASAAGDSPRAVPAVRGRTGNIRRTDPGDEWLDVGQGTAPTAR
ncbi:exported hypothetical protein [Frankia canadensis]|uniref:Secreted protein n=1 Tax=Frankia canadensis TaxID=1836972 RepID=A0A2I2KTJ0_9ACTN|nr:exported hypothetical protein [Frankia canadensis]SOU56278.1 exported hypothetical protein [Frankia canadensis]